MRPIPKKLLDEMLADPFYKRCIYGDENAPNHNCKGRIEFEHAWIYAGRQINEKWAIVPACSNHNRGPAMVKDYNRYRALARADVRELKEKYPKRNWEQDLKYLKGKYDKTNNNRSAVLS